eukprot:COSAG02_NODE_7843_length_2822_cov_6.232831_5_plen_147_part_01
MRQRHAVARTIMYPMMNDDITVMLIPPPCVTRKQDTGSGVAQGARGADATDLTVPPGPHDESSSPLLRHTIPKHSIGVILRTRAREARQLHSPEHSSMSVFLSPFPSDSPLPIVPLSLSLSRVHPVLVHPSLSRAAYRASLSLPDTD